MDSILRFIFEMGSLKTLPRSGWFYYGVGNPETVGSHIFRTALLGMILAKMEGADESKVAKMLILHENAETRIGDLNSINKKYVTNKMQLEAAVIADQLSDLPEVIKKEFTSLIEEFEKKKTKEAVVAHDADRLECAIQAKEYMFHGNAITHLWIEPNGSLLATASAKNLFEEMKKSDSHWVKHTKMGK